MVCCGPGLLRRWQFLWRLVVIITQDTQNTRKLKPLAAAVYEVHVWADTVSLLTHTSHMSSDPGMQGRARALSVDGSRRVEQQLSRKKDAGAARATRDAPDMLETSHETLMQVIAVPSQHQQWTGRCGTESTWWPFASEACQHQVSCIKALGSRS